MHLQFANSVNRQLAFLLPDGLLESLSNATPDVAARERRHWLRQSMRIGPTGALACASCLEAWNFH